MPKNNTGEASSKNKNFVFSLSRASRCHACDKKLLPGQIVKLEQSQDEKEALCTSCAKLDALELVTKGSAKLSRAASKLSPVTYIVMKWSEMWKCYERIGIMVTPDAVDQALQETGLTLTGRTRPESS